jgi:hypothetical protein
MRIFRTTAALAAVGMVGLVFSAASPAGASTAAPTALPSLAAPGANAQSVGQAGYEITTAPASSSASASFTVPTVTGCTSKLTGIGAGSLIFTGSGSTASASGVLVFIVCQSGSPLYQAQGIVNGTATAFSVAVAPGDAVSTSVSVTATKTKVTFKDTTKAFSKSLSGAGAVPAVVLDGIDSLVNSSTGVKLPIPKFGTINYSAAKEDGKTPKAAAATAVDMTTTAHKLQILTGALSTAGNAWTETFKHA